MVCEKLKLTIFKSDFVIFFKIWYFYLRINFSLQDNDYSPTLYFSCFMVLFLHLKFNQFVIFSIDWDWSHLIIICSSIII